jgi:signal transduction histidine kinase
MAHVMVSLLHRAVIGSSRQGGKAPAMNHRDHDTFGFGDFVLFPGPGPGSGLPDRSGQDGDAGTAQHQPPRAEALGVVAVDIAHELNELLTIALGSLEQLRRQSLDERGQRQLERAEWSVRQAGQLAKKVLSFANNAVHDAQITDLNEVVHEFQEIAERAAGVGVAVAIKTAPEPLPARLDGGQLELVLLHLVRNAVRAMAGKGWVSVRTGGHAVDGLGGQPTVEVSVSDTGTGMPFDVVERATSWSFITNKPEHGTGLSMVQRFVAAAGGKVEIETALGKGTTVRLVFPRHQDAEEPHT